MDDQNQNPAGDQNTGWTPPVSTPEPSAPAGGEVPAQDPAGQPAAPQEPAQDPAAPPAPEAPAADPNAGQQPAGGSWDQGGNQGGQPTQ
jgi:hypothetical protein